MHGVVLGVAALACPVGMGLMMWFMAKGMRSDTPPPAKVSALTSVEALRDEHRRLGEQIDRLSAREPHANGHADRVHS